MTDDDSEVIAKVIEIERKAGYLPKVDPRSQPIDYIDPAPKPFIVQIPLVEYFERMKRHKADRWQHDFCRRLQEAAENRHIKASMLEFHAEPRLGKTSILSQTFPACASSPTFKVSDLADGLRSRSK